MLGKVHWINREKLATFILQCQDPEKGGISDRPHNMADVFHTYFGAWMHDNTLVEPLASRISVHTLSVFRLTSIVPLVHIFLALPF